MEKLIQIILGVVIGVIALLLIIICFCCKKKNNGGSQHGDSGSTKVIHENEGNNNEGNPNHVKVLSLRDAGDGLRSSTIYNIAGAVGNDGHDNNSEFVNYKRFSERSTDSESVSPTNAVEMIPIPTDLHEVTTGNNSTSPKNRVNSSKTANGLPFTYFGKEFGTDVKNDSPKDYRFRNMVSSEVRDELNLILGKDFAKSPEQMPTDDAVFVYPSQVREYAGSISNQDSRAKSELRKSNSSPETPKIPQPDYGTLPLSPVPPPYKKREFKGPYGADDLDDMNNPYTIKIIKKKRPSLK